MKKSIVLASLLVGMLGVSEAYAAYCPPGQDCQGGSMNQYSNRDASVGHDSLGVQGGVNMQGGARETTTTTNLNKTTTTTTEGGGVRVHEGVNAAGEMNQKNENQGQGVAVEGQDDQSSQ